MTAGGRRKGNRTRTLLRGLQSSGLCVLYHDAALRVRLVENAPRGWPSEEEILKSGDAAIFDPFTADRVLAAKREVLASAKPQRIDAPRRGDGGELMWFEISVDPDFDAGKGGVRGLFAAVADVTEVKRREAALRDLLFEVSHRSRNMLAILQSILGQTAGRAQTVAEFEQKFRGRIGSIAQSQDLLTYANWQAVRFRRLVEAQIAPFVDPGGAQPWIEGVDPLLSPNTALHLGLALHELAANSQAFGVLGRGAGSLVIRASQHGRGCRIDWIETPDEPLDLPADAGHGFGNAVLQSVTPRALDAAASYAIDARGVRYALDLPAHVRGTPEAVSGVGASAETS